jgi:hypothetical protein
MPSSTLPSNVRLPRLALRLIVVGLLIWTAAAVYTLRFNPEIRHFVETDRIKRAWAEKMTREHGAKLVVYGGSSCEFSIDGEQLLKTAHLPCVNLGRGAGMGSAILTMAALEETRSGDTLIVALEPGLITDPIEMPTLGIQFSVAVDHWNWIRHPLPPAKPVSWAEAALSLRPGGFHTFTMLGKLIRGQKLYRYRVEEMRPSGWSQTPVRLAISGPPEHGVLIPPSSRQFLRSLSEWCRARKVKLAYSLPWGYTPPEKVRPFQIENLRFLLQVIAIMPVLKDARLGAYSERDQFADTAWHLTGAAARLRTDELGDQVTHWKLWTAEELEAELKTRQ